VESGGHLDESLEQEPHVSRRDAPDVLPHLVRVEESAGLEAPAALGEGRPLSDAEPVKEVR
jgi:hypothetical protein